MASTSPAPDMNSDPGFADIASSDMTSTSMAMEITDDNGNGPALIGTREFFFKNAEISIAATQLFVASVLAVFHFLSAFNSGWHNYSPVTVTGISVLTASNLFRMAFTLKHGYRARVSHVCTVVDGVALFLCLYSFVGAYDLSPATLFKGPATGLIFVYVAIQGIKLDKVSVFVASSTAIVLFIAGIIWMSVSGRSDVSHSYVSYLTSDVMLLGAEFERLIYLIALSLVLAVCAHNGQKLLEDLTKSRDDARVADRAKSEFLANMSHEIRTPMNGVMGMAELLTRTELDAKQKMFTDVIVKSGTALLTIINDILDFSKISAGQMKIDPAPFAISEAIGEVATLMSPNVRDKKLELIVRVDPALPRMLVGDVGRVRQIITNIVGNAVKFTERGHVYVNVEMAEVRESNPSEVGPVRLRITIEDTGIGIAEKNLSQIFEQFSQVDASATRKFEGTGLGLSIAASLTRLMGGEIDVESKLGVGSTFRIEIPFEIHTENETVVVPAEVTGARVLVVDDNSVNQTIFSELLSGWGFDGAVASSGAEGLAVLEKAAQNNIQVDCVILDYQMPEMTGAEMLARMKDHADIRHIPVIMMTSVDQTEEGAAFSSLGIQGHLLKPTRSEVLLETLIATIQRFRSESSDRAVEENDPETTNVQSLEPVAAASVSNGRLDVLICEDNEVNQIVFTQILRTSGLSFEIAENGAKGVELYKRHRPLMILMDVSMPEMNGLEAAQAIRELEAETDSHTPIVGVTAHALTGDRERCIGAGMDDYLTKPISPSLLMEKIQHYIGKVEIDFAADA